MTGSPLDNPLWHSLATRHAGLGVRNGNAACYRPQVSAMAGLAETTPAALEDLSKLVDPGGYVLLVGVDDMDVGPCWRRAEGIPLVQMVCDAVLAEPDLAVVTLTEGDVDDMMELVEATAPGPFERGTIEMGRYVGLWEDVEGRRRLVAMAGERMKPEGFTEISAVCTRPGFQGRGLGEAFVRAVAAPIQRDGDVPFLHVHTANERAIALYERLGFERRIERVICPLVRLG